MLQLVSLIGLSGGISGDVHASSVTNKQGIRSTCIRASVARRTQEDFWRIWCEEQERQHDELKALE
jgi:hypothetical protein